MGKTQIEYLRLLGYKSTHEDGAVLEHPLLSGMDTYVWKGDSFTTVMSSYTSRLDKARRRFMAIQITRGF